MRHRDTYGGRDIAKNPKPLDWHIEPENMTIEQPKERNDEK